MHDLLKKGNKNVDANEMERIGKKLREGWEPKTYK